MESNIEIVVSYPEQMAQRREKLAKIRTERNAYPNDFFPENTALDILTRYADSDTAALDAMPVMVSLAGRIMTRRNMGKAAFVHLQDRTAQIQLYVREDAFADSPEVYADFKSWDLGDTIGCVGLLFRTKTGELSVRVNGIQLLVKALRPLPDKYHGLTDKEACYRQRYVDLMVNADSRAVFLTRAKVIQGIRQFFLARDFLEVETPMMQPLAGGAAAKPFVTHHHALDMQMYLRIAPELYLKRLVVGGFERVFEINRNFRNEGLSTRHNPEFTMIEFYQSYATYKELMPLTEALLRELLTSIKGTQVLTYQGNTIDFSVPFACMTVTASIEKYHPALVGLVQDRDALIAYAQLHKIPVSAKDPIGKIHMAIFEETVETQLMQPTFITAYPIEVSPLARKNDENPLVTDRFEFFIGGREIANGFSELNDPIDQAERFHAQMAQKVAGDEEAMPYDEDYVTALEYGLPPTAGEGIGIDRLVMLFADVPSIRDVILFPHMRPVQPS